MYSVLGRKRLFKRAGTAAAAVGLALGAASQSGLGALAAPAWSTAGSMAQGRYLAYSAVLGSGKLLVAGGQDTSGSISSTAELFDPATGTWSSAGTMNVGREEGQAVVLGDGDVLVADGATPSGAPQATAELYHPQTNNWSFTGSMQQQETAGTTTLLAGGDVLVAGGYDSPAVATAELYSPSSGSWASAGSMATARWFHTATLLPSGKVLVAGGMTGWWTGGTPQTLSSAELYDPGTNTWSTTGSMSQDRYGASATLLPNGKVLVAGGFSNTSNTALSEAELYDPSTGTWSVAPSMGTARLFAQSVQLPDGSVFEAGGSSSSADTATAETYDPTTNSWSSDASMPQAGHAGAAAVLQNNTVVVAGGVYSNGSTATTLSTTQVYGPVGVSSVAISPGSLGFVSSPLPPTFRPVTLNGTNQSTTGTMPIDVGDATGSGQGWKITMTSTQFASGIHTLPASATTVSSLPPVACDANSTCTPASDSDNLTGSVFAYTLPASSTAPAATPLFNAQSGSGMGDQTVTPTYTLSIPANSYAGNYTSTWTVSVVSGP